MMFWRPKFCVEFPTPASGGWNFDRDKFHGITTIWMGRLYIRIGRLPWGYVR